uniref:GYF domain-containing protein n=1 Tax=Rhizophora mucronata TaxID=61149 RepID=A0A2P2KQ19_RHIMU
MSSVSSSEDNRNHQQSQYHRQQLESKYSSNCNTVVDKEWFVLAENEQHVGPYSFSEMIDHFLNGYILETTLVWSEGRSEWQPFSSISELISGISQKGAACPTPTAVPPNGDGDEFEKFQREVIEAEAEAEVDQLKNGSLFGNVAIDDCDKILPPPDGVEEFTEDDGTTYKWNGRLYVPEDNSSSMSEHYQLDEMTFMQEEEVFPTVNVADNLIKKDVVGTSESLESQHGGKRKLKDKPADKKESNKAPDGWFELKINTHVYVTGLPDDVTIEEVVEVFSKCGIIKEVECVSTLFIFY